IVFALARARPAVPERGMGFEPPQGQTVGRASTTSEADLNHEPGPASDVSEAATPDLRDPLTGLPSHLLLRDRLTHALARAHRHERPVPGMFVYNRGLA